VRLEHLAAIRHYERFRTLVDDWIALGLNAAQLQRHSDSASSKLRPKTRVSHKTGP
jgi:hypothetical protein